MLTKQVTPEQLTLTAVLALLIGQFEACVIVKQQGAPLTMALSGVLGGLIVLGFVLLWNSLLR